MPPVLLAAAAFQHLQLKHTLDHTLTSTSAEQRGGEKKAFTHELICEPTTGFKGLSALILQSLRLKKKKSKKGDTHGTSASDVAVAVATEVVMEQQKVNEM